MLIDIEHQMQFEYTDFIRESQMEIRVEPWTTYLQSLHSFQLAVGPEASVHRYTDWNNNWVHHLSIRHYHDQIEIVSKALVETSVTHTSLSDLSQTHAVAAVGPLLDFSRFCGPVERAPKLEFISEKLALPGGEPLDELFEATGMILHEHLEYRPGSTTWQSTVGDSLEGGAGVCQDFAHVALALLRMREIPCRYVGGYLHDDQELAQGHAWIEVCAGEAGWIGYDPTHQSLPDERYVKVAHGRHYDDVSPNRGVYRGLAAETFHSAVRSSLANSLDSVNLHRRMEGIDVPVYTELPSPAGSSAISVEQQRSLDTDEPQQQQQQQQ